MLVEVRGGGGGASGELTAEVCSEAGADADFDENYGIDEAGYGGDDAAMDEALVYSARSSRGKRANPQYAQPKNANNPQLLAPANLQLSHKTSWQAQNRYIQHDIRNT